MKCLFTCLWELLSDSQELSINNITWKEQMRRLIRFGRDVRRALVQPLAQSSEVRPGGPWLYPVRSRKSPRMEKDCITCLDSLIVLLVNFWQEVPPFPCPRCFFTRLNMHNSLCLFSQEGFTVLKALCWTCSKLLTSVLCWEAPNGTQ